MDPAIICTFRFFREAFKCIINMGILAGPRCVKISENAQFQDLLKLLKSLHGSQRGQKQLKYLIGTSGKHLNA